MKRILNPYVLPSVLLLLAVLCLPSLCYSAEPSAEDVAFLTQLCKMNADDLKVIPQLSTTAQDKLAYRISKRDCNAMKSFLATRKYVSAFMVQPPPTKTPFPPGNMDSDFIAAEEQKTIDKILDDAFGDALEKLKK